MMSWREASSVLRNTNQMALPNIIRVGYSNDSMSKDQLNSPPDRAVDLGFKKIAV